MANTGGAIGHHSGRREAEDKSHCADNVKEDMLSPDIGCPYWAMVVSKLQACVLQPFGLDLLLPFQPTHEQSMLLVHCPVLKKNTNSCGLCLRPISRQELLRKA